MYTSNLSTDIPRVPLLENTELFRAVFDITAYHPPSSISIPSTFKAPNLAISKLYWKGWILLLVLAAFNPKTIGAMLLIWVLFIYVPVCVYYICICTYIHTYLIT